MPDNRQIHIAPNKPLFVALVDPEGEYDDGLRQGRYQTTAGEILVLPRPAGSGIHWTVALSTRSELARAEQEEGQDLTPVLQASIEAVQERKAATGSPTPIRRPVKKESAPESQPRLFDRGQGTGTYGPSPAPPNTANWSDQSRQDLASTILIAAYRAGHIGLWERGE